MLLAGGSPVSMALTPLLGAVGGAFSALVLAALLIVLAIRARTRRANLAAANRDAGKTAAAVTATVSNGDNDKDEDDNNPDLIPGKGGWYITALTGIYSQDSFSFFFVFFSAKITGTPLFLGGKGVMRIKLGYRDVAHTTYPERWEEGLEKHHA